MGIFKKLIVLVPLLTLYFGSQIFSLVSPQIAEANNTIVPDMSLKEKIVSEVPSVALTLAPPTRDDYVTTELDSVTYTPVYSYIVRGTKNPEIEQMIINGGGNEDLIRIMYCESSGNPQAYNVSGAAGLFQFMPDTWRRLGGSTASAKDAQVDEQVRLGLKLWNHSLGKGNWVCK